MIDVIHWMKYPRLSMYSHFISKKSRHHITTVSIIIMSLWLWSQQTLACMIYCNRKCMKHYKEQQPSFFQTGGWLSFKHTFMSWMKFRHIIMLYYRWLISHIFSFYGICICVTRNHIIQSWYNWITLFVGLCSHTFCFHYLEDIAHVQRLIFNSTK